VKRCISQKKVCKLSNESSDVVRRNVMSCDTLRRWRCRTEAWKDAGRDRKEVGRDRSMEETQDEVYCVQERRSSVIFSVLQERGREVDIEKSENRRNKLKTIRRNVKGRLRINTRYNATQGKG
jgi:hypothetical protein